MKITLALVSFFVFLLIIGFSIFVNYSNGFLATFETNRYMVHYLSDKPFLVKIFDYRFNDLDFYRARDLGNVFNLIDSYLVFFSFALGVPHFLSITHYISMMAIASLGVLYQVKKKTNTIISVILMALLGLLYLSSPAAFWGGAYFRTTKDIVALLTVSLYWALRRQHESNTPIRRFDPLVIALALVALGTIDETGIIIAIVFCGYFLFSYLTTWKRALLYRFLGSIVGLIGIYLYRSIIGPALVFAVIGQRPVLWGNTTVPWSDTQALLQGWSLIKNYFGTLTGSASPWVLGILICFVVSALTASSLLSFQKRRLPKGIRATIAHIASTGVPVYALGLLLFFSIVAAVMIKNHPPVFLFATARTLYYPIPFLTLWFLALTTACLFVVRLHKAIPYILFPILLGCIVINLTRLPSYWSSFQSVWEFAANTKATFPVIDAITQKNPDASFVSTSQSQDMIYLYRTKLSGK